MGSNIFENTNIYNENQETNLKLWNIFEIFPEMFCNIVGKWIMRPYPDLHSTVVIPKGRKIPLQLVSVQWAQIVLKIHKKPL